MAARARARRDRFPHPPTAAATAARISTASSPRVCGRHSLLCSARPLPDWLRPPSAPPRCNHRCINRPTESSPLPSWLAPTSVPVKPDVAGSQPLQSRPLAFANRFSQPKMLLPHRARRKILLQKLVSKAHLLSKRQQSWRWPPGSAASHPGNGPLSASGTAVNALAVLTHHWARCCCISKANPVRLFKQRQFLPRWRTMRIGSPWSRPNSRSRSSKRLDEGVEELPAIVRQRCAPIRRGTHPAA